MRNTAIILISRFNSLIVSAQIGLAPVTADYDNNGNVTSLLRYGRLDNASYGLIDNLTYTYNGNQLLSVTDGVDGPNYTGAFHFIDRNTSGSDYEYDKNGNLKKDKNKNILSIQYNLLNLPTSMALSNYNTANWTYDAQGTKLRSTFFSMSPYVYYNEDYCGSFVFRDNELERVHFDEGYITLEGNNTQILHYYLKDHQGNVRMVVENGPNEQTNEYYPYGGLTYNSDLTNTVQPYKYNGKELDRIHGLDMYDYGARQYDPNIGRFTQVDPLAEKYYHLSPYAYCGNNPVNAVDPDGSLILFINGFHTGDGASSSYWGGLDSQIMQLVEDYNVEYIDGSMGGICNSILSNISNLSASQFGNTMTASNDLKDFNNLYPSARFKIGELYGFKYAKEYFGRLKEGETIKLVTHSMGAAFAKGLIQGLKNFANSNDINAEGLIESELDLAPYQPDKQTAASNVATTAISHMYDWIARYKPIEGASSYVTRKEVKYSFNFIHEHSVESFSINEIKELWRLGR